MKHFYLVFYFSDSYSDLVKCDSMEDVFNLRPSAPDGSNIHTVHVYEVCREFKIDQIKRFSTRFV